jgi:hypothetical protein
MNITHRRLGTHGEVTNRIPTPFHRNVPHRQRLVIQSKEPTRISTPSRRVTISTTTTTTNTHTMVDNSRSVVTNILVHYFHPTNTTTTTTLTTILREDLVDNSRSVVTNILAPYFHPTIYLIT